MAGLRGRDAPRHPGAEAHADAPKARRPLTGRGQRPTPPAIVTAMPTRRREAARLSVSEIERGRAQTRGGQNQNPARSRIYVILH